MVEHFCSVVLGDPCCVVFWDIVREKTDRQTHKRSWKPHPRDYRWRG